MKTGFDFLKKIAPDCPSGNYATGRPLSYSSVKGIIKDPLSYVNYVMAARSYSDAFDYGNVFENVLLREPKNYIIFQKPIPDKDFKNKENKEYREEMKARALSEGKILMEKEIVDIIKEGVKYIKDNFPQIYFEMGEGESQVELKGRDEETGLNFIGYKDCQYKDHVYEIKTIISLDEISKRILYSPYSYWIQAGMYGLDDSIQKFTWLFHVKTAPYMTIPITLNRLDLDILAEKVRIEVFEKFDKCLNMGFDTVSNATLRERLGLLKS